MNDSAGTDQRMLSSHDKVSNAQMPKSRTLELQPSDHRDYQLFASNGAVKICIIRGFSLLTALGHLTWGLN